MDGAAISARMALGGPAGGMLVYSAMASDRGGAREVGRGHNSAAECPVFLTDGGVWDLGPGAVGQLELGEAAGVVGGAGVVLGAGAGECAGRENSDAEVMYAHGGSRCGEVNNQRVVRQSSADGIITSGVPYSR